MGMVSQPSLGRHQPTNQQEVPISAVKQRRRRFLVDNIVYVRSRMAGGGGDFGGEVTTSFWDALAKKQGGFVLREALYLVVGDNGNERCGRIAGGKRLPSR